MHVKTKKRHLLSTCAEAAAIYIRMKTKKRHLLGTGPKAARRCPVKTSPSQKRPHLIVETCKVGDKRTILHSSERGRNLVVLLVIYDYGKLKYKNWIHEKKQKRCQNMPEIVFFWGGDE